MGALLVVWNILRVSAWLGFDVLILWAIGTQAYTVAGAAVFMITAWQLAQPYDPNGLTERAIELPWPSWSISHALGACVFALLLAIVWPIVVTAAAWNKLLTIQARVDD